MASEEGHGHDYSPPEPQPLPAYRTKHVQFLGRSTPIILQNDNGPCPLLAVCNVLLLRNSLDLGPDSPEVPLNRILSAVAEKLIDSNSHIQFKDDEYAVNQQQNIGDAIDLLPRLATGIDVNVQFRKVNDFEFTRECAIFDLLDIGLYHGWLVDPQDTDMAAAIGSKSYNTLVGEYVSFVTRGQEGEDKGTVEEDSVDFAAATTAALGVPSPCLSRGVSFDDCPTPVPSGQGSRRGDKEEEEELMRALNLSKTEISTPVNVATLPDTNSAPILEGSTHIESYGSGNPNDSFVAHNEDESQKLTQADFILPQKCSASSDVKDDGLHIQFPTRETDTSSSNTNTVNKMNQLVPEGSDEFIASGDLVENAKVDILTPQPAPSLQSTNGDLSDGSYACEGLTCHRNNQSVSQTYTDILTPEPDPSLQSTNGDLSDGGYACEGLTCHRNNQSVSQTYTEDFVTSEIVQSRADNLADCDSTVSSDPVSQSTDLHSSNGRKELTDVSEVGSSSLIDSEPIYEGEEHIHDFVHSKFEVREPVYEGEIVLAEQSGKMEDTATLNSMKTQKEYHLIKNFLENSASQLTIYGLFCLQEGLKERELCVFFRNNHFSTMFKFKGELYILATDQGYIDQPDLVWEKLNEVNGDTVFMTGNFEEFKIDNQVSDSWNEQSAMTNTADYPAEMEGSEPTSSSFDSDHQLAIKLQENEYRHQSHRGEQQTSQPPSAVSGGSRLITGPQVSRSSHAPQRSESKSKDKCRIM
ncbi:uncharacterized protein M6B38_130665 [Iris pallida]|uniref:MINDY deubiquitinase domain-containing protein n=1 Tax=Iris pallida TaxID=29817 RepID=A0AAX6FZH3_IRIPA|nr:uncharacterized protein M6B38_130665 [Iris pallida]